MADLADVEKSIVGLIASIIFASPYNSGDYQASLALAPFPPATIASPSPIAVPIVTKLYRGWPEEANLDADLALGRAHVSVFAEQGMTQLLSRYFPAFQETLPHAAHTLAWVVAGNVATLSGTVTTPQNIAIVVDQAGYSYAVQAGDTLTTAAAGLTALIAVDRTATSTGPAITIPNSHSLVARVGTVGTSSAEVRRMKQGMRVSVWTASPLARDVLCGLIDTGIGGLLDPVSLAPTQRITLTDGSSAYLTYRTTYVDDKDQKARLWRRDLCYQVEYADFAVQTSPELIVPTLSMDGHDTEDRVVGGVITISV